MLILRQRFCSGGLEKRKFCFFDKTDPVSYTLHRSYVLTTLINPEERVMVDYKYYTKLKLKK